MTEENETPKAEDSGAEEAQYFVEIRGQRIELKRPSETQIAAWRLISQRLVRLDPKRATGEDLVRAFEKILQIMTSLPTQPDDREWLEDLLVSGEMDLEEASGVIEKAAAAWEAGGNRETRRASKVARTRPSRAKTASK